MAKDAKRAILRSLEFCNCLYYLIVYRLNRQAVFNHVFKDLDDPATEAYMKDIAGNEVEIEFLTDDSVRNNKHKNVLIAGVVAQPYLI